MKLFQLKYLFSQNISTNHSHIISSIFTNQSIPNRINTFKSFNIQSFNQLSLINNQSSNPLNQSSTPKLNISIPSIVNPSFLNFDSAKNLSLFIKSNHIPPNIRILHALAHIQYNAFMAYTHTYFSLSNQINNHQMRQQFKQQIKRIALDQGDHFCMLNDRLQQLGWKYGSLPVIDQLCLAIQQTKTQLIQRLARISLLHQGKGMKAISKLINQLQRQKDYKSIQILRIIQKQQIYHFQNGVKWFANVCRQQNKNINETLKQLLQKKQLRLLNVDDVMNVINKYNY